MKLFNYGGKLENYKQTQKLFIREAKSCLYESTWKDILTYQVVTFWTKLKKKWLGPSKALCIENFRYTGSISIGYWCKMHLKLGRIKYFIWHITKESDHHWKTYGSLPRNNKWILGSFSLSWPIVVILNHFVNVHWTALKQWNLETSVSCNTEMQWKLFHSALKIPATILLTVCYFVYQAFSPENFLLNETSSYINYHLLIIY